MAERRPKRPTPPEVPLDPRIAALKPELEEWGSRTLCGILAGMLYGGCKEAYDSGKEERSLLPSQAGSKDWPERRKLLKDMAEARVLRITKGTVLGGFKLGAFTALFCGIQQGLGIHRGMRDTTNTVAAATITAAIFGLASPGSLKRRASTAALGAFLGAAFSLPLGYVHTALQEQLVVANKNATNEPRRQHESAVTVK